MIIFGGKTYLVNKKIASENGEGELVEESIPRSAATANGTTNNAVTNVTAGSDNKGGVSSNANVETNSPNESISQKERDNKPKFELYQRTNQTNTLTYTGSALLADNNKLDTNTYKILHFKIMQDE